VSERDPFGRPPPARTGSDPPARTGSDPPARAGSGPSPRAGSDPAARAGADPAADAPRESAPEHGWCEERLRHELPGLAVVSLGVELAAAATGPSPAALVERLREQANRWRGARLVAVRQEPVPAAYRTLFRQIGLDPDRLRTPIEQALLVRVLEGGFHPRGLLPDVLALALLDTAVPVWALDADAVAGALGIRAARAGEPVGHGAPGGASDGPLVVADEREPVAILFGEPLPARRPRRSTRRLLLYAVQAPEVPSPHVDEALAICRAALVDATRAS
jgi:DNA/RNA-binding domain of Phe-tRNA-synthetase-like protein